LTRHALVSFTCAAVAFAGCQATKPRSATTASTATAASPAPDPEVVRALRETYAYKPHELSQAQQHEKLAVLDKLWASASQEPQRYLPALRAELAGDRELPFFYYDGGQLLMKLSSAAPDRALALEALKRVDLQDIAPLYYVETVHRLARDDLDTSAAAFRIFEEPSFDPYVAEHDLHLHQSYSLLFMLLPSAHAAIGPAVIARYPQEKSESAKTALLMAAYDLAPLGDPLLRSVAADAKEAPAVRAYAETLVKAMSSIAATDPAKLPSLEGVPSTVAETLAARRKAAGRISDEALDEIDADTLLLRTWLARDARKKP
jgi:hypothetical protein